MDNALHQKDNIIGMTLNFEIVALLPEKIPLPLIQPFLKGPSFHG